MRKRTAQRVPLGMTGKNLLCIPIPEPPLSHLSGLLLEAVGGLLAVPDGPGQRELPADAVLADGAQRTPAQLLGLDVVRLHPQHLREAEGSVRAGGSQHAPKVCAKKPVQSPVWWQYSVPGAFILPRNLSLHSSTQNGERSQNPTEADC